MNKQSSPSQLNPYIAGNPVGGGEAFVGRADVLREVLRSLDNPYENALVLYGQRRIGKTSLLQELASRVPLVGPFQPIYFDLQDKAALPLSRVLQELAFSITKRLLLPPPPTWGEEAPRAFREEFIPDIIARLPPDASCILLFDEFDVLDNLPTQAQAGAAFFPYLRELLSLDRERLKFIFVIGRRPEELSSLTLSVFKGVKALHVSLLPEEDTAELVLLAERNKTMYWPDEAIARVQTLTGGHPFLTQQLCKMVWERAYQRPSLSVASYASRSEKTRAPTVLVSDVDAAVPSTISSATNSLEWLWNGLQPAERIVASALAEAGPTPITQVELERRLMESGVRVYMRELRDAPRVLEEWDMITPTDGGFRFPVELLRRWIAKRKPLNRVWEEVERLEPVADNLYQAAHGFYRGGQLEQALPVLRQTVGLNPNHLRANLLLAEILLAQGEFNEALLRLEGLYKYHPVAARPRLVQALLLQAEAAETEDKRLSYYESVLELEPNHPQASLAHQRIWEERGDYAYATGKLIHALRAYRKVGLMDKVKEVELEAARRKIEALGREGNYQAALNIAQELYQKYPEQAPLKLPNLKRLERKTLIDTLYQEGIRALQRDELDLARSRLAEVISLDPRYMQATGHLHLAVTGTDIIKLQQKLRLEQESLQTLKRELTHEKEARQKVEGVVKWEREERQKVSEALKKETIARQKAEAMAQQEAKRREKLSVERLQLRTKTLEAVTLASQLQEEQLYASNASNYFRLLWWVSMAPQHLKGYQQKVGKKGIHALGKWLASSFTWLPLLFPTLALGLSKLPYSPNASSPRTYLTISALLSAAWLVTGWFGDKDNDAAVAVAIGLTGIIAGAVAGMVTLGMGVGLTGGIPLATGLLFTLGLAVGIAFGVAGDLGLASAIGVTAGVAGIISIAVTNGLGVNVTPGVAGIIAGVLSFIISAVILERKSRLYGGSLLAISSTAASLVAGIIAGSPFVGFSVMIALLAAFGVAVGLSALVAITLRNNIQTGHAPLMNRVLIGVLLLAHLFLFWYTFLNGWKLFG